jgi:sugar phosphate isomerase/epimerase
MELSFQLYSARNFSPWATVLATVSALGYTQVEGYSGLYDDPVALKKMLDDNALTMPTGHMGIDDLADRDAAISIARILGMETIFCPAIPEADRTSNDTDWQRLGASLAAIGNDLATAGIRFGWHNHNFEFKKTDSGNTPLDLILEGAPDIAWECDVAWVDVAGEDPLAWIRKYANRVVAIHIKDRAPAGQCMDEDGWADVGHGTMDWPTIIKAVKSGTACTHWVMEHDNPSDYERFARRSIATLNTINA